MQEAVLLFHTEMKILAESSNKDYEISLNSMLCIFDLVVIHAVATQRMQHRLVGKINNVLGSRRGGRGRCAFLTYIALNFVACAAVCV